MEGSLFALDHGRMPEEQSEVAEEGWGLSGCPSCGGRGGLCKTLCGHAALGASPQVADLLDHLEGEFCISLGVLNQFCPVVS